MPNRVLRGEALRNSEPVGGLSDGAFRFYILLLTYHEDYGRFDARDTVLRTNLFPFRIDRVREADIARWKDELLKAGMIALFDSESKPFGVVLKTGTPRAKSPTIPEPPEGVKCWRCTQSGPVLSEFICERVRADETGCVQTRPNASSYSGSNSNSSLSYSGSGPPQAGEGGEKLKGPKASENLIDRQKRKLAELRAGSPK